MNPEITRRTALKGGSAAAVATGAYFLRNDLIQKANAQTGTEPRLQLGQDWEIDDYQDSNGDTNLRIRHIPSGAELYWSNQENSWVFPAITTDSATIGGETGIGVPTTPEDTALTLGGGWTTLDANRPTMLYLRFRAETDGSNTGDVRLEIDFSGGTSSDIIAGWAFAPPGLGSGNNLRVGDNWLIPPGASVQLHNQSDPNNGNVLGADLKLTL